MMITYITLCTFVLILLIVGFLTYKSSRRCKEKYFNNISELEGMINTQMSINNSIQDKLDYINVHILAMEDRIINIVRSKEEIYEGTMPMDSHIYTKPKVVSKENTDFSFETAKEKLSVKRNKKDKITKIDVHKEIKKKVGVEWFVIRKMAGEEVYKEAYKKAYQRLYYRKNKNK